MRSEKRERAETGNLRPEMEDVSFGLILFSALRSFTWREVYSGTLRVIQYSGRLAEWLMARTQMASK